MSCVYAKKKHFTKEGKNVPSYPLTIIFRCMKWRCVQNAMISVTTSHTIMHWNLFDVSETRERRDILQIIYRRMNLNYDRAMDALYIARIQLQAANRKKSANNFLEQKKISWCSKSQVEPTTMGVHMVYKAYKTQSSQWIIYFDYNDTHAMRQVVKAKTAIKYSTK